MRTWAMSDMTSNVLINGATPVQADIGAYGVDDGGERHRSVQPYGSVNAETAAVGETTTQLGRPFGRLRVLFATASDRSGRR